MTENRYVSDNLGTPKYWYRMYYGECPVCGRDAAYRKRVYGEKPKDPKDRYVELPQNVTYCGCAQ